MDHSSDSGVVAARLFLARTTLAAAEVHAALYCAERMGDDDSAIEMREALRDTTRLVAMATRAVAEAERAAREEMLSKRAEVEEKILACLSTNVPRPRKDIATSIGVRRADVEDAVHALVQAKRVHASPAGVVLAA